MAKRIPQILLAILILAGGIGLGLDPAQAQTAIFPINKSGASLAMKTTGPTISIIDSSGVDITGTWLPEPDQSVTIRVNGVANPTITLTPAPTGLTFPGSFQIACSPTPCTPTPKNPFLDKATKVATTSAYPEICTNFPSRFLISPDVANLSADFTLAGSSSTSWTLTAKDCGGMAVIVVGAETYILPQDSDFDGIPDIYEAKYPAIKDGTGKVICAGLDPLLVDNKAADTDCSSYTGGQASDGIANFDEYRGFMVSPSDATAGVNYTDTSGKLHKHIRTNPRQKDVFVHLVNPQCIAGITPGMSPAPAASVFLTSTASLLGGGAIKYLPTDGTTLFSDLSNLDSQVHFLDYNPNGPNYTTNEWVDNFVSYAKDPASVAPNIIFRFTYKAGTNGLTSDRQINQWSVFPLKDAVTLSTIQKGLRITECLDTTVAAPTGTAGWGSANGPDNAVLFTQRIADYISKSPNGLIPSAPNYTLRYVTWDRGVKLAPTNVFTLVDATGNRIPNTPINATYIIAKSIQFYLAMEMGHAMKLNTTNDPTYGYHTPTGSGDNLDGTITNKTEASSSSSTTCSSSQFPAGCNTFYVPSTYSSGDQTAFKVRN
jgi:hypothetical protein